MFGGQGTRPMSTDQVIVHEGAELFIRQLEDLIYLMRGTESVEEMEEWNARLERCRLCNRRKVVGFLHGAGGQQCPTRLADRHHILVIAVDREGVRRDRARGDMEDRAGKFAR